MSMSRVSPSLLPMILALVAVVASCASTGGVEPLSSTDSVAKVALRDWSAVEALDVNTRLRVLTRVPGEPEGRAGPDALIARRIAPARSVASASR